MKIILKTKTQHLQLVINNYYNSYEHPVVDRVNKVVESISRDIMLKLERKLITKRKESKAFKITLKYHEAFALLETCKSWQSETFTSNDYEINVYRLIINEIDKQL